MQPISWDFECPDAIDHTTVSSVSIQSGSIPGSNRARDPQLFCDWRTGTVLLSREREDECHVAHC